MATAAQKTKLYQQLKKYKNMYLRKQYTDLNEADTRIMVNSLLTDVLGYTELEEIKTEYRIRGEYADYVIQLARKKHFVIEVKAIQLDLTEKHLRQSLNYAANEGIDWVILTNGRQLELYKVIFAKPIGHKKILSFDLTDLIELKKSVGFLFFLTKKSVLKEDLEHFWKRFKVLEPKDLSKNFYSEKIVRFLRRKLKKKTGFSFSEEDIMDSIHQIITTKIVSIRPKAPIKSKKRKIEKGYQRNHQSLDQKASELDIVKQGQGH